MQEQPMLSSQSSNGGKTRLTVYLRLLDVPVPGMHGPSADETM